MLVNLVLRTTGENLLLAPVCYFAEGFALNEVLEGLFVRPFTGDQIGSVVTYVLPERRRCMACGRFERVYHSGKFLFEIVLLAWDNVIVHSDGDHLELSSLGVSELNSVAVDTAVYFEATMRIV